MRTLRRLFFILLVSSLALTLASMRYGGIPIVRASPTIYQGNLTLTGNNVTTITGTFNINGSIIVENNATLILKNAVVNFTQTSNLQYNMTFQNPTNGHPRLIVETATLMSPHNFIAYLMGNTSCVADKLHTMPSNPSEGFDVRLFATSSMVLTNSPVDAIVAYNNALFEASNSSMRYLQVFDGASANVSSPFIQNLLSYSAGDVIVSDSAVVGVFTENGSLIQLVNSTYSYYGPYDTSRITVSWYLGVNVVDSHGTPVGSANVTASYSNATVVESKLTDVNGLTRLTLMQETINATGSYPVGNYTVTAKYGIDSGQKSVNMTGNQAITISLPFNVPEFPSVLVLPAFIAATLIAVVAFKRKQHKLE